MLRLLLLVLILANGLYFAWTQGFLRAYGFAPTQQSEPQRIGQQVQPQALRVLSPAEFKKLEDQAKLAQMPTECLVAGPFTQAQSQALRRALEDNLPAGVWKMESVDLPARWIIYMGKFTDAAILENKRRQLAEKGVMATDVATPALVLGLSLGSFEREADANAALAQLAKRGVRTARVVLEREQSTGAELSLPAVTATLKPKLDAIGPQLAGVALRSCAGSAR